MSQVVVMSPGELVQLVEAAVRRALATRDEPAVRLSLNEVAKLAACRRYRVTLAARHGHLKKTGDKVTKANALAWISDGCPYEPDATDAAAGSHRMAG